MDDDTDRRTLMIWQSVTFVVAGMAVVFLMGIGAVKGFQVNGSLFTSMSYSMVAPGLAVVSSRLVLLMKIGVSPLGFGGIWPRWASITSVEAIFSTCRA